MPYKPELKFREHDCYKMYYCGVCKSIGRNFGQVSRFGLINESAILALLMDLCTKNISTSLIKKTNCIAHPFNKSDKIFNSISTDYAAGINIILMYFKLEDNKIDDKSILAAGGELLIKNAFKKAVNMYPIVSDSIYLQLLKLNTLERQGCTSIDEIAEPFSALMRDILKWKDNDELCTSPLKLELLGNMGYNLGKWIYLIDALADIERDKKENNYNIFNIKYPDKLNKSEIKFILEMCLAKLSENWEELKLILQEENNIENIRYINGIGVIDNLIYLGMRHLTEVKAGIDNESL